MKWHKLSLKIVLSALRGLVHLKRLITFFFSVLGGWLSSFGPAFSRYFLFPLYKVYLKIGSGLAFLIDPIKRQLASFSFGRSALTIFSPILILVFLFSETKVYAKNKYLSGQDSLIFHYLGAEGDFDISEEISEPGLVKPGASWISGAVWQPAPFSQTDITLDEITGTVLGETALLQPLFLPGAVFGSGRAKTIFYIVEAGDNFGALAQKFSLNIETLLWANNLQLRSILRPGDILKILPVSGVAHKVVKGDTVKKIAALYSTTEAKILEFNRLADSALRVGEEIIVPDGRRRGAASVPSTLYNVPPRALVATLPPSAERAARGLIWPTTSRRVTQYFRWRHPAIDIGLPTGNPIYASEAGVVETAGWNSGGYGYMVLINHGNSLKTRYAHASRVYVRAGERVNKGQVIGLVGSTGRSTGPHVHFEVLVNNTRVNPLLYVR